MAVRFSDDLRRDRLAALHHLAPEHRIADVAAITDDLVALHSSDPASVYLSVCARLDEPSIDEVANALYGRRDVIRHHAMRRTLWVMTPPVARAAHASSTRKLAGVERRKLVAALGGDGAWVTDAIEAVHREILKAREPLGTREIKQRLPELARPLTFGVGTRNEVTMSAHTRVLLVAGFEGRLVRAEPRGSWIGSEYAWTDPMTWLGSAIDEPATDTHAATAEFADRWLRRFGPAPSEDLQWWTGWTKTAVRRALADIDAVEVELDDGSTAWLAHGHLADEAPPGPWVALLPGLDPTAMGWRRRAWYLDDVVASLVTDRNGNIGPTIWADGRVVGGWVQRPDGSISTELSRPLDTTHRRLLRIELERLTGLLGDRRFRVRFPSPNQADLFAARPM
jgi:hypothetical protein